MSANKVFRIRFGGLIAVILTFGWSWLSNTAQAEIHTPESLTWQIEVIDYVGDVGLLPSLALESGSEDPYISYYDNDLGDLKLAFPVGEGGDCGPSNRWSCHSLSFQNITDFGLYSSLAFNSQGDWGIAYQNVENGNNEFRGIPSTGGQELFFEPIEDPALTLTLMNNMRFAQNDVSHVSYGLFDLNQSDAFIKHAQYVGQYGNCGDGQWACETVVETTAVGWGIYNSLAMLNNLPYIFYRDINQHLSIAVRSYLGNCGLANDWSCFDLDPSIIVNGMISSYFSYADNYLGVAYIGNDALRYAYAVPEGQGNCGSLYNEYQCVYIDQVGTAPNNQWLATSMGLYNGQPIIAYTDVDDWAGAVLKVAYPQTNGNCGPYDENQQHTWQCETVDGGLGRGSVGFYPSLQVDSTGSIHIAYYDLTAHNLKYALSEIPIEPTPTPTATPLPGTLTPRVYLPLTTR